MKFGLYTKKDNMIVSFTIATLRTGLRVIKQGTTKTTDNYVLIGLDIDSNLKTKHVSSEVPHIMTSLSSR